MSKFVVSALKYRPRRFDDVVGQAHVSQTLKNALKQEHLAHAFLFCGPRGVGKTTCARILARLLNCQNISDDFEACNSCPSCSAFADNASFNITELDAASNNSVEHIRTLIDQVRFQPQQGKFKVFIIDEVHMLSQQAFNAFLKTLEEPPPYAIFILATTEKHKIIPTILSRCQIFDFRRIQVPDMITHLQYICTQEGIQAEREALHLIAQKADGALRDALSIFDRMVSSTGKNISYDALIEQLNILDYDYFFKIVDALLVENLPTLLNLFGEIIRKGFEPDLFINGLAEHLRNLLICQDEQTVQLLEVGENVRSRYLEQAKLADLSFLLTALNIANECDVNYRMARNKRLHVEMALIKMCFIGRVVKSPTGLKAGNILEKKTFDARSDDPKPEKSTGGIHAAKYGNEKSAVPQQVAESGRLADPSTESKEPLDTNGINGLTKSSKFDTSRIMSLDEMEKAFDQETTDHPEQASRLSLDNLQNAWNEYIEMINSPSGKNALFSAQLELDSEQSKILVLVGSKMIRDTIKAESSLINFLRVELKAPNLLMEVKIDKSRFKSTKPTKRKKPLTVKEKYEKLKEANSLVDDLRKRFDLKIDPNA